MYVILRWIAFALVIMFTAWVIPGITVENFWAALIVALVLGVINAFIKQPRRLCLILKARVILMRLMKPQK